MVVEVTWVSSWGKKEIKDWNISFYMLGNKIETKGQTSSCSFLLRCGGFLGGFWVPFSPSDSNINPLILAQGLPDLMTFPWWLYSQKKTRTAPLEHKFSWVCLMCTILLQMPVIPALIFNSIMIQMGDSKSAPWLLGVSRLPFKGGGLLHKSGD